MLQVEAALQALPAAREVEEEVTSYQGLFDNTDELDEACDLVVDNGDLVVSSCQVRARLAGGAEGDDLAFDYGCGSRSPTG